MWVLFIILFYALYCSKRFDNKVNDNNNKLSKILPILITYRQQNYLALATT